MFVSVDDAYVLLTMTLEARVGEQAVAFSKNKSLLDRNCKQNLAIL